MLPPWAERLCMRPCIGGSEEGVSPLGRMERVERVRSIEAGASLPEAGGSVARGVPTLDWRPDALLEEFEREAAGR